MLNTEEKISIVVPVYNATNTLERCVTSLLEQTYRNIEIILVNDGSTDNSYEICTQFCKKDFRVQVVNKSNGGVSSARNAGIEFATGKYLMFCDSDDWVEPNWCQELLHFYQPDNLCMCGYYIHDDNAVLQLNSVGEMSTVEKNDYFTTKCWGGYSPWNKIFDANIIKKHKLSFNESISLGEDMLFVWDYLKSISGKIIILNKMLNHYSWPQNNSLTLNVPRKYYSQCDLICSKVLTGIDNGIECSKKAYQTFVNDYYWQYFKALRRVYDDMELSYFNKKEIIQSIIQSKSFRIILRDSTCGNWLLKKSCLAGKFHVIYILFKLNKI